MRRYMLFLAAAFCAGVLTLLSPASAEASHFGALAQAVSTSQPQSATLLNVGYYGGGDYYGDDQKSYDDGYDHKQDYNRGYDKGGYGGNGYYGSGGYDKYDDNGGYHNGCCKGCYKKKWVCEESEPRCRKARECVWYYGKEYCRYVRRCHGGGDRYCKWVTYPSHDCGY